MWRATVATLGVWLARVGRVILKLADQGKTRANRVVIFDNHWISTPKKCRARVARVSPRMIARARSRMVSRMIDPYTWHDKISPCGADYIPANSIGPFLGLCLRHVGVGFNSALVLTR